MTVHSDSMGYQRMLGLRTLPIVGAMLGYGCSQAAHSSTQSLETQGTTSPPSETVPSETVPSPVAPATALPPGSVPPQGQPSPPSSPTNPAATPGSAATTSSSTPSTHGSSASSIDVATTNGIDATSAADASEEAVTVDSMSSEGVETTEVATTEESTETLDDATSTQEPPANDGNVINGPGGVVNSTIVVRAGEIYDGGGKTFTAGSALGDGSQDEDQLPVFRLEDGAQLRNVTLGSPAADGIHCYGDVTLNNINWLDIGEDAMTIKESGTVVLDGGSARDGEDKVFQINAPSTFIVRNFTAKNAGKFIRQNGDTTFKVDVTIEKCDISQMDECIFRTDSSTSTVTMRDTRYSDLGDGLFVGVNQNNITLSNNTEY